LLRSKAAAFTAISNGPDAPVPRTPKIFFSTCVTVILHEIYTRSLNNPNILVVCLRHSLGRLSNRP
jgi:hypothetical protein